MKQQNQPMQRASTRFSKDGTTALVTLRIDRRDYEFARAWAAVHAEADPHGTAEDQLEGHLALALMQRRAEFGWTPPPEIAALFTTKESTETPQKTMDDGITW